MTKDEFAAIKGREKVTTPGPWEMVMLCTNPADDSAFLCQQTGNNPKDYFANTFRGHKNDAEFIVHARSDVPVLIAEIERLNEELDTRCPTCKGRGQVRWKNKQGVVVETTTCPDCGGTGAMRE